MPTLVVNGFGTNRREKGIFMAGRSIHRWLIVCVIAQLLFAVQSADAQRRWRHRTTTCNKGGIIGTKHRNYGDDKRTGRSIVLIKADDAITSEVVPPTITPPEPPQADGDTPDSSGTLPAPTTAATPTTATSTQAADATSSPATNPPATTTLSSGTEIKRFHVPVSAVKTDRVHLEKVGMAITETGEAIFTGSLNHNGGVDGGLHGSNVNIHVRAFSGTPGAESIADAIMVWDHSESFWVWKNRPQSIRFGASPDEGKQLKRFFQEITHLELELEYEIDR